MLLSPHQATLLGSECQLGVDGGFDGLGRLTDDVSTGTCGAVERGERNVSFANILKIATALEVPASGIYLRAEALLASK